ncbi:MAG: hypothetical protein ACJ748_07655 [Flavisolibacter sp.]
MILSFLFYFFLFYLGYRLLFNFIIPVIRTTLKVRKGFRDIRKEAMKNETENERKDKKVDKEDYIDFEEIR